MSGFGILIAGLFFAKPSSGIKPAGVSHTATLLPFLPGGYDTFAAPLSLMARVFGFVGLLLVPVGACWAAAGYSKRFAGRHFGIAFVALIASSIVWVPVSLAALATSGVALGAVAIGFWIYVVARVWPRVRLLKTATSRATSAVAYYLLIVPIAVTLLQMAVVPRAIDFSRNRAIQNSAPLIAELERHRAANGRYPASLLSVHADIHPGVIGIEKYHYEPSGDAYNLLFEQPALHFGTREFVVYNPLDQQPVTSHRLDRLQLTPGELALEHTRGHNAVHNAVHPHWKYFWFD